MIAHLTRLYWTLSVCLVISACDMNIFGNNMPDAETFFEDPQALELAKAIEQGEVDTIRKLAPKLDLNQQHVRGMTYLNWAIAHLNYESTETLLALKADPYIETEGSSPLSLAMLQRDVRWLKLMVESGVDVNSKKGSTPILFSTIYANHWSHFDYLIDQGVDLNARAGNGRTVIFLLASFEEYEKLLEVIDKGADVTLSTFNNLSFAFSVQESPVPTDHAEYEHREKVVKILEEKGIRFPVLGPREIREQRSESQ